jgi:hypothetical protein
MLFSRPPSGGRADRGWKVRKVGKVRRGQWNELVRGRSGRYRRQSWVRPETPFDPIDRELFEDRAEVGGIRMPEWVRSFVPPSQHWDFVKAFQARLLSLSDKRVDIGKTVKTRSSMR